MTLGELLKEKEADQRIKVGAKCGTAYYYCGTVGDYLANSKKIDKKMESEMESGANRARKAFMKTLSEGFAWKGSPSAIEKKNGDTPFAEWAKENILETTKAVHKAYDEWLLVVGNKEADAVRAEQINREKISLMKREVDNLFVADHLAEPEETLCIIIEGWEYGKFWSSDEAEKAAAEKAAAEKAAAEKKEAK